MSCCGGGSSGGNMNMSMSSNCPSNDMCCNLYKVMMDPCSKMLERNVLRNVYGQTNSCCPPPCPPPRPMCCGSPCSVSPCCPAPRLTLCQPDSCSPCCQPMKPCPPRCPTMPCFPKVCCPPPCCPDPCIRPSRKCFIPPPCCPPPCCKKMALVVSPPICPPRCCPPLPCCPPDPCACPCPPPGCCPVTCPSPAMIVRPIRNNCCPPPPKLPYNQQCPIPCCNPLPPCCVIVKPCQPRCPPSPCCPPPPVCGISCPRPDPRCCPKPMVVSFKCPTAQCPMPCNNNGDNGCSDIKCPVIRADQPSCCPQPCPPRQTEMCMMTVRPMPPRCCPSPPSCKCYTCCNRLCCRPRWDASPSPEPSWSPDYCFPCMPPVSCRYSNWIAKKKVSQTDSNLLPSRLSSCVERNCCNFVAVDPPAPYDCGDACPCHCPNPGQC